mmetsp:Transcript_58779/g.182593  ORF Transcript_58779/g.182593 Transcript_58779/m.182593 type:complete len:364 (+) Transcript_58779:70-1161(+)
MAGLLYICGKSNSCLAAPRPLTTRKRGVDAALPANAGPAEPRLPTTSGRWSEAQTGRRSRRCKRPLAWAALLLVLLHELLLLQLAHLVPGELLDDLQLLRNLVGGQTLLPPFPELFDSQLSIKDTDGGDHLSPRLIRLAQDGNLLDLLVLQEHALNLQCRDLVASALDDIDGGAAHNPVDLRKLGCRLLLGLRARAAGGRLHRARAVLHRLQLLFAAANLAVVAGHEPAVLGEVLLRLFLQLVILAEDEWAFDEDTPVLISLHLDPREGPADAAGEPRAVDAVAQAHADLRHAVPLEEHVARDLGPGLHRGHGQGGGARNHVPHGLGAQALLHLCTGIGIQFLEVLCELGVDGGHGVEASDVT